VDDHLRSSVKACTRRATSGAGPVLRAPSRSAIEPTAQEHGRVVGANMASRDPRVPRQPHRVRRSVTWTSPPSASGTIQTEVFRRHSPDLAVSQAALPGQAQRRDDLRPTNDIWAQRRRTRGLVCSGATSRLEGARSRIPSASNTYLATHGRKLLPGGLGRAPITSFPQVMVQRVTTRRSSTSQPRRSVSAQAAGKLLASSHGGVDRPGEGHAQYSAAWDSARRSFTEVGPKVHWDHPDNRLSGHGRSGLPVWGRADSP
jgi:hypothetical protein